MSSNLKNRILQAASELFYSQGIKSTGVDAIVKAAGTTKMSLYKYFPSKDDLVLAHLRKSSAEIRAKIVTGIDNRTLDPKEKLLTVFDVLGELLSLDDFRGCPFINASAEFALEDNPVQQASAEFYDGFRDALADIGRHALANNPEELACQLVMLISGAIVTEQMKKNSGAMTAARRAAEILIAHSGRNFNEKVFEER